MKTFKDFLSNTGIHFVGLMLDSASSANLRKWAIENGFDLEKSYSGKDQSAEDFHFHLTIFYTSNKVSLPNGKVKIDPITIKADHFELLGKNKNVPVMKIKADGKLLELRKQFEEMGLQDEWPSWLPHVSLSYNYSGEPDIKTLKLPDFDLVANMIEISKEDE